MSERIWIMGASEGIGAALARAWAARGARLILSARSGDRLTELAEKLGGAEVLPCDVTDRETLAQAARQIGAGGPLDRAVTLAALYDPGKVMQIDPDRAGQIVTVNLTGCFLYGLLLALAERRMDLDPNIRRIVFVGFMGAFTTFSSLISDTVTVHMAQEGMLLAMGRLIAHNALGIGVFFLGTRLGSL